MKGMEMVGNFSERFTFIELFVVNYIYAKAPMKEEMLKQKALLSHE